MPAMAMISPADADSHCVALESFEGVEHLDGLLPNRAFADDRDGLGFANRAANDAADGEPADVVVVREVADDDLQGRLGIARRWRHLLEDGLEQRAKIAVLLGELALGQAGLADGVDA